MNTVQTHVHYTNTDTEALSQVEFKFKLTTISTSMF